MNTALGGTYIDFECPFVEIEAMFNIHILILKLYADSFGARRSLHMKHLYEEELVLYNKTIKPNTTLSTRLTLPQLKLRIFLKAREIILGVAFILIIKSVLH